MRNKNIFTFLIHCWHCLGPANNEGKKRSEHLSNNIKLYDIETCLEKAGEK